MRHLILSTLLLLPLQVFSSDTATTTYYPSSLFEESDTGTSTKHIYANNTLIATIEDDTPATKTYHVHTDHLNSTNVLSTSDGYIEQLLQAYPYGDSRIDEQYGGTRVSKQYHSHTKDCETEFCNFCRQHIKSD